MNRLLIFMFAATGLGLVPGHTLAAEADQKAVAKGETVRLTIVTAQGGGWGGANKARAALRQQGGVKNIVLSGMRATVVMEEGKTLDEDKVRDALGAKRLKFVSLEVVDRPIPKAMYNMKAKGVTWAITADKARVALEELDGCSDAYVDPRAGITLLFSEPKEVDEKALQELLKTYKIRISDLKKVDKMPY